MSNQQVETHATPEIQKHVQKKQELLQKIRQMQAEVGTLNVELARLGASHAIVACW
jgi:hypothetical protein